MGVRSRSTAGGAQYGLAVSSTVVTLTVPAAANVSEITVRDNPVVFTRDGTDPTATKGMIAYVGDVILLNSRDEMQKAEFIREGADATLDIEYFTDLSG